MREDEDTGNSPVVPRGSGKAVPATALYPCVPRMDHDWFCEKDVRTYECSCGLWQLRLDRGDFVRYDASMCPVTHHQNLTPLASDSLGVFLRLLVEKTANVDMARFDQDDL